MDKRGPRAANWCFTINNYTDSDFEKIKKADYGYLIIGKEKSKDGTPHLQGYIQLMTRQRLTGMKKIHPTAHWENARGTAIEASEYCKKEKDFEETGTLSIAGKRKCDMVKCVEQLMSGVSSREIMEEHGAGYIMNRKRIIDMKEDIEMDEGRERKRVKYAAMEPRGWQKTVVKILDQKLSESMCI